MNRFAMSAAILSAAILLSSTAQAAMPIQVFDRMSNNDQADYVANVLVGGAEQVLKDEGRSDQTAQVEKLFTTVLPGDQISVGSGELELNLSVVRQTDADNLVKDANARPVAVEIAVIMTLKNNGIILPKSIMHVGDSFQPKGTLSPPPKFGPFSQCFAYRNGACVGH